jgi:hypothetical protein
MTRKPIPPDLTRRLALLGWEGSSAKRIEAFYPVLEAKIDQLIRRFYHHLLGRPETARLLESVDITGHLIPAQRKHWLRLFRCEFDAEYVIHARRIGEVHYRKHVPLYAYMASYNYFLCLTLGIATDRVTGFELPLLLADISRLVSLDMELSLSAYVRERWRHDEETVLV